MDAPVVAALKAALSTDNVWLERSTIAVFFGVVIEMADLIFFNKEMGRTQRIILFVATVLVVAGCGGEWVFEHDASDKEARLQQISDEKVAGLANAEAADNKIAQTAADNAAHLGVKVDKLPAFVKAKEDEIDRKSKGLKDFADADKRRDDIAVATVQRDAGAMTNALNAEREMRQQFAAVVEPRTISDEQAAVLKAALGPFRGQVFEIATYEEVKEPTAFSNRLKIVLQGAEWIFREEKIEGPHGMFGGVTGVHVRFAPNGSSRTKIVAAALVDALNKEHFDATLTVEEQDADPPIRDAIVLVVGMKP